MKKWLRLILTLLVLCVGCENSQTESIQTSTSKDLVDVELVEVIDGDTIKVNYNGKTEMVRYLLIDTPEVRHHTLGNQPFGDEASARNEQLLKNSNVSLEFDVGERYDDYGRLLAYVYTEGQSIQEILLQEGLARVAYVFEPNTRHVEAYKKAEKEARNDERGIWQVENYATERGFDATVLTKKSKQVSPKDSCVIKGNINRENKKIYHLPTGKYYEQTKPEKWFCTEQQAREAGFKKSGE